LKLLQITGSGLRRRVAAVEKGMHRDGYAGIAHDGREGSDLVLVRMDPARRNKPHDMRRAAALFKLGDKLLQRRQACDLAFGEHLVDAREILDDDPAGTDIGVADLGIAHLPVGQTNVCSLALSWACGQRRISSCQTGVFASSIALSAPFDRSPQPSRMQSISGFGREVMVKAASQNGRSAMYTRNGQFPGSVAAWQISHGDKGGRPGSAGRGRAVPTASGGREGAAKSSRRGRGPY